MEKPLVSIVTITRNRGNMLRRCIKSVLSQTYTNIEHIVVDGASDDNTDDVIDEFSDNRLKFIKLESNWPIKETIDHGVSLCKGKYISFLDSDDEYLPSKIEKQVNLIESLSEDFGLVYCWMTYYDNETRKELHAHKAELKGDVCDQVISEPVISGTPTLMFRSELLRKLDGWKSPDETGIISDWELCARTCQITKVDFVPESLVKVYVNHGHTRMTNANKYYADTNKKMVKFHTYFLSTYAQVFEKYPERGWYHYHGLVMYNTRLGNYSEVWKYYKKLLRYKPSISYVLLPIKEIVKKVLRWK